MQGRRIYPDRQSGLVVLQPGDYAYYAEKNTWYAKTPNDMMANLAAHTITLHEDDTITVHPSILVHGYHNQRGEDASWHGYLEKGVWREC